MVKKLGTIGGSDIWKLCEYTMMEKLRTEIFRRVHDDALRGFCADHVILRMVVIDRHELFAD
jgi:hypothetical protein